MSTDAVGTITTMPGLGRGVSEPARRMLEGEAARSEWTLEESQAETKRFLKQLEQWKRDKIDELTDEGVSKREAERLVKQRMKVLIEQNNRLRTAPRSGGSGSFSNPNSRAASVLRGVRQSRGARLLK